MCWGSMLSTIHTHKKIIRYVSKLLAFCCCCCLKNRLNSLDFSCIKHYGVAGHTAQLAECLPRQGWLTPVIPALRRYRQKNQKWKLILGHIVSSRPAWDSGDSVLKTKTIAATEMCVGPVSYAGRFWHGSSEDGL